MVVMVKVLLVLVLVVRTAIQTGPLARSSKVFFFSFPCFPCQLFENKTKSCVVPCFVFCFLFGLFSIVLVLFLFFLVTVADLGFL